MKKMEKLEFKIKNDRYLAKRGGTAKIIRVICASCKETVFIYQKDMPRGWLKRCYLNRILAPEKWESLQYKINNIDQLSNLTCTCGSILGTPMKHKDDRLAFKLIKGKFIRKTVIK